VAAGAAIAIIVIFSSSGGLGGASAAAPRRTAIDFAVCSPRVVVTAAQRLAAGLPTWPDGTFGVVRFRGHDRFIAANGARRCGDGRNQR
jgi:hypothetical protein